MTESTSKKLASTEKSEYSTRPRARTSRSETAFADIKENAFFKVIFSDSLSLEDKVENVTKILEFSNDKESDRARIQEFDAFKEYLQSVSEEMSKQRIEMTDTEVFAELQRVYADFNDDLNDFIEQITPLTEITDALYKLRQSGETRNALAQIKADQEWEVEKNAQRQTLTDNVIAIEQQITDLKNAIFSLSQDKSFFGFGQIKPASKAQILSNEAAIEKLQVELQTKTSELTSLIEDIKEHQSIREQSFETEKLKELLNLTSEEHTERQAKMVESALKFVNQGKERFGAIRGH